MNLKYFDQRKEKAKIFFKLQKNIHNPYLDSQIIFNSDGFHHLRFSARRERNKKEQILKFNLLPLAIKIIKKSGTLQEYRKGFVSLNKRGKDGFIKTKNVEYWGFIAIIGNPKIKVRVILRKIGDGNIIFWSVLPDSNLKRGQKLFAQGIEDE